MTALILPLRRPLSSLRIDAPHARRFAAVYAALALAGLGVSALAVALAAPRADRTAAHAAGGPGVRVGAARALAAALPL